MQNFIDRFGQTFYYVHLVRYLCIITNNLMM